MKKTACVLFVFLLLTFFLSCPAAALEGARDGLILWFTQLLPALLPFCIISYIVLASGLFQSANKPKIHRGKISSLEWYIIFCGFLFGFPIGCKLAMDSLHEGQISRKNAKILACFANNLSPVFVTTALREQLQLAVSPLPYFLLYGIPLISGVLWLLLARESSAVQKKSASRFQLNMQIIDAGIMNGFETLIRICGYVMMFSIISKMIGMLPIGNEGIKIILTGCLEVTNGIGLLAKADLTDSIKYLLALVFLSWNGLSGLCQTASLLKREGLPLMYYVKARLLYTAGTGAAAAVLLLL
ncbi:MAG: hypothetical protein MR508_03620 [Lachnospiraceae bacterium]|nr:hypothetical protein [Lachnospiraceae bacterium]